MVRQRGRKDSQTPSTKSMPNNSNLDYKRKLTTISLSPRIDRKFNTKSRSPSYDKMEIISIGTEEIEKDEIRKISTSSKPSLSPVNEGMFFFILDFSRPSSRIVHDEVICITAVQTLISNVSFLFTTFFMLFSVSLHSTVG